MTFTGVLASTNFQVQSSSEESPLEALRSLIKENRAEIKEWLEDLLSFSVCSACGRKHAAGYGGECQREDCDGASEPVLNKHGNIVEGFSPVPRIYQASRRLSSTCISTSKTIFTKISTNSKTR